MLSRPRYIFAVLLLMFFWCLAPKATLAASTQKQRELTLNVIPIEPQDITITSTYVGYVTPIKSVDLVPNVSGYIEDVFVQGGQDVKVGDNLVLIDQREYKAALNAAIAATTQAQANFNNAKVYYERIKKAGKKAISQTEFDNAKAEYLSALGNLEEAKANQAKAQVMYDYTVLQSSIDGVVGNVDLTKGNYVAPGSGALLSIIQYDPIRVVFSISDKEYLNEIAKQNGAPLFAGEKIMLKLSNGNLYKPLGEFKFTDNSIDKTTGSVAVYADFANHNHELMANAYVDVLLEKNVKDAVLVRQNYVVLSPDGNYVYTIKNNQLLKTPVTILDEQNGNYVLANRFAKGEYLVTDKVGNVGKDTKVKIKIASTNGEKK